MPLLEGMTLVTYANPLDFKAISNIVREEKVTLMAGTPTFFWGYLRNSKPGDYETVRILLTGADKCPEALRHGFLQKHGKTLLEAYGTTETSPGITVNTLAHNRPGSVGRPLDGVQVRVENYETGEACAVGEIGKILVKGDNVMKGYFDDFEQTSLSIRHGWYDTGDMGYMDADGYFWHVGRLKRFLKIGGEMVSLVKVEDVLEKLLPDDVECCVVEIPDPLRGARIVAAVTQQVDEKAILDDMAEQLPKIALPSRFVVIPEMPKHGSGKIDFRTITERAREIVSGQVKRNLLQARDGRLPEAEILVSQHPHGQPGQIVLGHQRGLGGNTGGGFEPGRVRRRHRWSRWSSCRRYGRISSGRPKWGWRRSWPGYPPLASRQNRCLCP